MACRYLFMLGALFFVPGAAAHAQNIPPPAPALTETLAIARDRNNRVTVDVTINGQGPYPFVVDTGAERTVIARELAQALGLQSSGSATLLSMTESQQVDTVLIPALNVTRETVRNIAAPALERQHLGAFGLIGIDSLKNNRIIMDFRANTMRVIPSADREPTRQPGARAGEEIIVTARNRLGQLIVSDAAADGQAITIIIDTGSQTSIANPALLNRIARRAPGGLLQSVNIVSVTGGTMTGTRGVLGKIKMGGVVMRDIPVAFADAHPFRKLGLDRRPALLLGMDVLRLFDQVSIDFARRKIHFILPDEVGAAPTLRMTEKNPRIPENG